MPLRIEALGPGHRQLLVGFQNQHTSLVEYLKRYALRHATKDLLARTFLAIDDAAGEPRLAGYFSLATVSVERASVGGPAGPRPPTSIPDSRNFIGQARRG